MRLGKGFIQVYTGNGKGKTTAALGLALRAAGHGMKIIIIQFMKGRTDYGELRSLERFPEISIHQFGRIDFVTKGKEKPVDFEEAGKALDMARNCLFDKDLDILILDEVNVALYFNLLKVEDVLDLLDQKPGNLEIILTGRKVPDEIIKKAHLVTRMKEVKHYYSTMNQEARAGIEH